MSCTNSCRLQLFSRDWLCSLQRAQKRKYIRLKDNEKDYHARKLVGFSDMQMYAVVSDVRNYQKFVPFCTKSTIISRDPKRNKLLANLQIGFPPIIENYTSHVELIEPRYVSAKCKDGHLFNYLETTWRFSPGLRSNQHSCIIDFYIRFQFQSLVYSKIANLFFEKLVSQMEIAFISEAKRRYGKESVNVHKLDVPRASS